MGYRRMKFRQMHRARLFERDDTRTAAELCLPRRALTADPSYSEPRPTWEGIVVRLVVVGRIELAALGLALAQSTPGLSPARRSEFDFDFVAVECSRRCTIELLVAPNPSVIRS